MYIALLTLAGALVSTIAFCFNTMLMKYGGASKFPHLLMGTLKHREGQGLGSTDDTWMVTLPCPHPLQQHLFPVASQPHPQF
jgi:hypothetical protein